MNNTIPDLVTFRKFPKFIIEDPNITDSLKVFYRLSVRFKHPLKDTTKIIEPVCIRLIMLRVTDLKNKRIVIDTPDFITLKTNDQKYIWELCDKWLLYWMYNQDYTLITSRFMWDYALVFSGVFYIMPETEEVKDVKCGN
ncbi:MAG: hypothetical protein ACRCSR_01390 [Bacteroidales bacterium]